MAKLLIHSTNADNNCYTLAMLGNETNAIENGVNDFMGISGTDAFTMQGALNYRQMAWRWLGRFLPIIVLCAMLFAYNVKAENIANENKTATELAQVLFNPNSQLMQPWPVYEYEYEYKQNDECCIEFTLYAIYYPAGEPIHFVVTGAGDIQGGTGNISQTGKSNGVTATICASNPPADIHILVQGFMDPNIARVIYSVSIPAALFANCNQQDTTPPQPAFPCYPDSSECGACGDWEDTTETLYLDEYPNCPIKYSYSWRFCCGNPPEVHIANTKISVDYAPSYLNGTLFGPCTGLYNEYYNIVCLQPTDGSEVIFPGGLGTVGGGMSGEDLGPAPIYGVAIKPGKGRELDEKLYGKVGRKWFDNHYNSVLAGNNGDSAQANSALDCNNPTVGNPIVTYYKGGCVSYCSSYYYEDGMFKTDVGQDKCSDESCCKLSRLYCIQNGEITYIETRTSTDDNVIQCVPNAIPNACSCRTENVIFIFRTFCQPNCAE